MTHVSTWMLTAALALGGLTMTGCHDSTADMPPGENGTRAGGNGAFGSNTVQPGEGTHDMNGTGNNGMDMHGVH